MSKNREVIAINSFLVVDGHSIAYRGLHALNANLSGPDGTPTSMIVGFMNMLFKAQEDLAPDCTVIVFDAGRTTFRHELLGDYKASRPHQETDISIQFGILERLLPAMGHRVVIREGVEADDVAASIARLAQRAGDKVTVLSSDKDLFQILGGNIQMMRPVRHGISGAYIYTEQTFLEEYQFSPSSMADYLAIVGDSVDNIKGITGIGDIGAKKLLSKYPTLEAIFAAIDELPAGTQKKLRASGLEEAVWRRDNIIRLRDNLFDEDHEFLDDCLNFEPDFDEAERIALSLGLLRILRRIGSKKLPSPSFTLRPKTKFMMPRADVIADDYKAELTKNPKLFDGSGIVWDLKTAYYLLHPDESGKMFPSIIQALNESPDPPQSLANMAGTLQAEIDMYDGLADVMNNIDLPLIPVLIDMEHHGVRLSFPEFRALHEELETRIQETEQQIIKETGIRINVSSSQQVSWLLFECLGFEPVAMTRGRTSYATDANVLERLANMPGGTVPGLILEHRELTKMLTGFVVPLQRYAGDDGIIHTTFEPAFTGTGRLSSREPNLQNLPAFGDWAMKIKAGLVPVKEGNVFVSADYSQIELRVLAFMSQEEKLIEAFAKGRDIHTETASWVFGVMPELVTPELRRAAKMINFGLIYGMTSFGLSDRLGISRKEAQEIMTRYFDALPGIRDFLEGQVKDARASGFSRTLAGRIRRVSEIPGRGASLDRALINSPIQGTAADIARRAMINFARDGVGELFLQVHDSLVCECEEREADDAAESLREIMRASGGEIRHLEVEIKRGRTLADV